MTTRHHAAFGQSADGRLTAFEPGNWREIGFFGNVFIRRLDFQRGQSIPGHTHKYDHATFIGQGRVSVKILDTVTGEHRIEEYTAPAWLAVPAQAKHEIVGLDGPCTVFCVFAARDEEGQIAEFVDEHTKLDPALGL